MDKNIIRSIIFLVAGLISILFPGRILKMQSFLFRKFNIKSTDSKKSLLVLGICFLVISVALFLYATMIK